MQHPPAISALLFDAGGVLIDVDMQRAFKHWAGAARVPVGEIAARFSVDAAYKAYECGEISGVEFFAALRTLLGINIADEDFADGWRAVLGDVIPGIPALLQNVSAHAPVYIFSNTNEAHYTVWKARFPALMAPVTRTFCSHEIGLRKPSIAAYEKVCALIGLSPQRIAFFDDLPENIAGARDAGLIAFHAPVFADLEGAVRTLLAPQV